MRQRVRGFSSSLPQKVHAQKDCKHRRQLLCWGEWFVVSARLKGEEPNANQPKANILEIALWIADVPLVRHVRRFPQTCSSQFVGASKVAGRGCTGPSALPA